ncbi:MAG: hypothetical protein IPI58_07265 [Alphaproteobacteria bacterium]|nr:MAG: hypothetical protein IPI58_07265 [Alphaproteobacteria bacterium]
MPDDAPLNYRSSAMIGLEKMASLVDGVIETARINPRQALSDTEKLMESSLSSGLTSDQVKASVETKLMAELDKPLPTDATGYARAARINQAITLTGLCAEDADPVRAGILQDLSKPLQTLLDSIPLAEREKGKPHYHFVDQVQQTLGVISKEDLPTRVQDYYVWVCASLTKMANLPYSGPQMTKRRILDGQEPNKEMPPISGPTGTDTAEQMAVLLRQIKQDVSYDADFPKTLASRIGAMRDLLEMCDADKVEVKRALVERLVPALYRLKDAIPEEEQGRDRPYSNFVGRIGVVQANVYVMNITSLEDETLHINNRYAAIRFQLDSMGRELPPIEPSAAPVVVDVEENRVPNSQAKPASEEPTSTNARAADLSAGGLSLQFMHEAPQSDFGYEVDRHKIKQSILDSQIRKSSEIDRIFSGIPYDVSFAQNMSARLDEMQELMGKYSKEDPKQKLLVAQHAIGFLTKTQEVIPVDQQSYKQPYGKFVERIDTAKMSLATMLANPDELTNTGYQVILNQLSMMGRDMPKAETQAVAAPTETPATDAPLKAESGQQPAPAVPVTAVPVTAVPAATAQDGAQPGDIDIIDPIAADAAPQMPSLENGLFFESALDQQSVDPGYLRAAPWHGLPQDQAAAWQPHIEALGLWMSAASRGSTADVLPEGYTVGLNFGQSFYTQDVQNPTPQNTSFRIKLNRVDASGQVEQIDLLEHSFGPNGTQRVSLLPSKDGTEHPEGVKRYALIQMVRQAVEGNWAKEGRVLRLTGSEADRAFMRGNLEANGISPAQIVDVVTKKDAEKTASPPRPVNNARENYAAQTVPVPAS